MQTKVKTGLNTERGPFNETVTSKAVFPPMFVTRSVKTGKAQSEEIEMVVKTEGRARRTHYQSRFALLRTHNAAIARLQAQLAELADCTGPWVDRQRAAIQFELDIYIKTHPHRAGERLRDAAAMGVTA